MEHSERIISYIQTTGSASRLIRRFRSAAPARTFSSITSALAIVCSILPAPDRAGRDEDMWDAGWCRGMRGPGRCRRPARLLVRAAGGGVYGVYGVP